MNKFNSIICFSEKFASELEQKARYKIKTRKNIKIFISVMRELLRHALSANFQL